MRRVLTIEVDTSIGTLCPATPLIVVLEPSGKFDHDAHADRLPELGEQRLIDGVDVDLRGA